MMCLYFPPNYYLDPINDIFNGTDNGKETISSNVIWLIEIESIISMLVGTATTTGVVSDARISASAACCKSENNSPVVSCVVSCETGSFPAAGVDGRVAT